jgi:hypothetical protein
VNEERAPVSFRAAKPVDKKTRDPFSGKPLDESPAYRGESIEKIGLPKADNPYDLPYNLVLEDLRRKRDEIDTAIRLIESLR